MLMTCPDCQLECTVDEASVDTYSCPGCGLLLYSKSGGSSALPVQLAGEVTADELERTRHWQASLEEILPTPEQLPRRLGRYELVELLGEGSFAQVYRASDSELQRHIAIKIPRKQRFKSSGQIARFVDEARTAAKLEHPGIVRVYDIGWLTDEACFIAMEYCVGGSLDKVLKSDNVLPFERTAEIMIEVAEAMHFAHLKGLVHRDLKPSNIMFGRDGRTRIVDFGLALPEDQQHDRAGEIAGTLPYMSPEQIRGETQHLDGRTDIWSLGIILYQLLTGRRPFAGDKQKLQAEILHREPKPLRQVVQDIPKELEDICLKCLVKPIAGRWATAQDIAEALKAWLEARRSTISNSSIQSQLNERPLATTKVWRIWPTVATSLAIVSASVVLAFAISGMRNPNASGGSDSFAATTSSKPAVRSEPSLFKPDFSELRSLDESPLKVWNHLIAENRTPQEFIFPEDKKFYGFTVEPKNKIIRLQSKNPALVRLGETNCSRFRLRATFVETAADGPSGFFWGMKTLRRPSRFAPPGKNFQEDAWQYFQIVFANRTHQDKGPTWQLEFHQKELAQTVGSKVHSPRTIGIAVVSIEDPLQDEMELEIEVAQGVLQSVRWGGKELTSFVRQWRDCNVKWAMRTAGAFGVCNEDGSTFVRNPEFQLLTKGN